MQNSDIKLKEIPMPISKEYQILSSHTEAHVKTIIVMTYISQKEENILDKHGDITIERGDFEFKIRYSQVYCYGDIDLTTNSEDFNVIDAMPWLNYLTFSGISLPSDYDYKNHVCRTPNKNIRWYETFSPAKVAQYYHGVLGKPKKAIIFYIKK